MSADATTTTVTTAEVIAENATNPLHGEYNTIGNEKKKATTKKDQKGKRIETKKQEKEGKKN